MKGLGAGWLFPICGNRKRCARCNREKMWWCRRRQDRARLTSSSCFIRTSRLRRCSPSRPAHSLTTNYRKRARGWDVGISTGDVALNLDAKVVVATLETQRGRFLRGEGPGLLVMDEFQMLGDPMRGVHYELAVALAPKATQLLFLSGSVANPRDVVAWLQRIGRHAVLIEHKTRPVPLEETDLENLSDSQFVQSRNFWPRMIGRAMRADLAPVLVFAPRRAAAEQIAQAIAAALPVRDPF